MRRFVQILSGLLVLGWIGWCCNRLIFEESLFLMVFSVVHESMWDWVALAGLVLAAFGFASVMKQPRRRRGMWCACIGLFIALLGGGVGIAGALERQQIASGITIIPQEKPNRSKTILGYYYRTPVDGGEVAFGDGSVGFVTAEEFATLSKATPPDRPGAWQSPTKTEAPAPIELAPGENPAMLTVRRAERRSQIGTDLRALAEGHFFHFGRLDRAPNNLQELMQIRLLDDRQRAAVEDGTYVWFFGWDPMISQKGKWESITRVARISYLGFIVMSIGVALLGFGTMLFVRSRWHT